MTTPVTLDVRLDSAEARRDLEATTRAGLLAVRKSVPSVWFYDEVGSDLFDQITRLPEYYPTRAERRLLEAHAHDVAITTKAETLVELGSGTCTKTRVLLDAFERTGTLRRYVAVDVAEATIVEATRAIAVEHPELEVSAIVEDFHHLDGVLGREEPTLVAFLGGTVGNLAPDERHRFFVSLDSQLSHADSFLLGTDLVKDRRRLVAAYNDAAGVTAAFNRNVLTVLNRELGADFDVEAFEHVARFDEEQRWIEMDLRSLADQHVAIPALGIEIDFAAGEVLRTEISSKFTPDRVREELDRGGFVIDQQYGVDEGEFLLTLSHPYC